jgi:hypothetical protein
MAVKAATVKAATVKAATVTTAKVAKTAMTTRSFFGAPYTFASARVVRTPSPSSVTSLPGMMKR